MDSVKRVYVDENAKKHSYYKYFNRPLVDIPEEKKKILENPIIKPEDGLELKDRNRIFEPGYLKDEIGVSHLPSGGYCFSNLDIMPGCTGEMLQWFFAWHPLENLRYSIWDPRDHVSVEISDDDRKKLMNPELSYMDKCQDVKHYCREIVIPEAGPISVVLNFKKPEEMGFDGGKINTGLNSFLICGNVTKPEGGGLPIVIMHSARDFDGYCEHRSRIWVGYQIIDRKEVCVAPADFEIPLEKLQGQLQHHFYEFAQLTEILPDLFTEEKENW